MNIQNYHNKNKIKQKQKKENKMDYLKTAEKVRSDQSSAVRGFQYVLVLFYFR